MHKRRFDNWLLMVSAVVTCFALAGGPVAAAGRHYWTMVPFVPEAGAKSPTWIDHALRRALADSLGHTPGSQLVAWTDLKSFYSEEGDAPPKRPWSDEQLAAIARKCGLDAVLSGRCRVDRGVLHVRFHVWTCSSTGRGKVSMRLSDAHYQVCGFVEQVAGKLGMVVRVDRPLLKSSRSFEMLGKVAEAYSKDKSDEAARLASEWEKLDSHSTLAAFWQASARWRDGHKKLADRLEPLVAKKPGDRDLWGALGWARENARDLKGARAAYQRTLQLDPGDAIAYADLARIARKLHHPAEARKLRDKANALPHSWPEHLWLGRHQFYDDYGSVISNLQAALQLGGPRCYTLNMLGYAFYRQRKWRQARETWASCLKTNPKSAKVSCWIGNACWRLRDWRSAEFYYRNALKIDPKRVGYRCNLAYVLYEQDKLTEAEAEARAVLKRDPNNSAAHHWLSHVYRRKGEPFRSIYHEIMSRPSARRIALIVLIVVSAVFVAAVVAVVVVIRRRLAPDGPVGEHPSRE